MSDIDQERFITTQKCLVLTSESGKFIVTQKSLELKIESGKVCSYPKVPDMNHCVRKSSQLPKKCLILTNDSGKVNN